MPVGDEVAVESVAPVPPPRPEESLEPDPPHPPQAETEAAKPKPDPVVEAPQPIPEPGQAPAPPAAAAPAAGVMASGLSWALVWALGWAPLGLFMGYFWQENRLRYAEIYESLGYELGWGYSIPGATLAFGLAGLLGGFVAGVILPRSCAGSRGRSAVVVLLWLIGWAAAIGGPLLRFLADENVSDDMLMFRAFGAGLLVALIAAQVAMWSRPVPPSDLRRLLVTALWIAIAAVAGLAAAIAIDF